MNHAQRILTTLLAVTCLTSLAGCSIEQKEPNTLGEYSSWSEKSLSHKTVELPDGRRMNGTLYKQTGNSMPVPILESIFTQLQNTKETL